jgi:subtilisin-like proprotein convertase family protein
MNNKLFILKTLSLIILLLSLSSCVIQEEIEPNDSFETATPLSLIFLSPLTKGSVFPKTDLADFYSLNGTIGDLLYIAVMPAFSAGKSKVTASIYREDKTTLLETDTNDLNSNNLSVSISGLELPATETYYLKIEGSDVRPYYIHADIVPTTTVIPNEIEPNNTYLTAQSLPSESAVNGVVSAADVDIYELNLQVGDALFISLDVEPGADDTPFNGKLSFSNAGQNLIESSNSGTVSPDSAALFVTVKEAGTYHITVSDLEGVGGANYNYNLNVDIATSGDISNCDQFGSSTPVNLKDKALTEGTIEVTDDIQVGRLLIDLNIDHSRVSDLDLVLESPNGTRSLLFNDLIDDSASNNLNLVLADQEGAFPIDFFPKRLNKYVLKPEKHGRLENFRGVKAQGIWKLKIYDDSKNEVGTLNSWNLYFCQDSAVTKNISCEAGFAKSTLFLNNFENNDGQLESSGKNSQWAYGTPKLSASRNNTNINSCKSGNKCWKTNLNGLYAKKSTQQLQKQFSLAGVADPITLAWSHRFQLDAANKSSYDVVISEAGQDANKLTLFQYIQERMEERVGKKGIVHESVGWGEELRDISGFADKEAQLTFKLKTKAARPYAGIAIDDLEVIGCFADSDSDGTADRDELCPNDFNPAVTNKCQLVQEFKVIINALKTLAQELLFENNKFNAAAKIISNNLNEKRNEFLEFVEVNGENISLNEVKPKLGKLTNSISKAITKQRSGLASYQQDKASTIAKIDKLLSLL